MPALPELLLRALAALALAALLVAAGHGLGGWLAPDARRSARGAATVAATLWLAASVAEVALTVGAFSLPAVLAALGIVVVVLARRLRAAPAPDLRAVRALVRSRSVVLLLALVPAALILPRAARALLAPPLAWDALAYHLWRAARWVQLGVDAPPPTPGSWRYCDHLPSTGDAFSALAMLPWRGDVAVGATSAAFTLAVAPTAYAAARALGAARAGSTWAALALATLPAVLSLSTAAYVDTPSLVAWLAGAWGVATATRTGAPGRAALGPAALGLGALAVAAGTKHAALPALAVGAVIVLLRTRSPLVLLAALPPLAGYARTWAATGNPLYPLPFAGLPGDPEYALAMTDAWATAPPADSLAWWLFAPVHLPVADALGFGPAGLILVALGLAGAVRHSRAERPGIVLAVATAVAVAAASAGPEVAAVRGSLAPLSGRLFLLIPGAAALLAARSWPRGATGTVLGTATVAGSAALALPHGWQALDVEALQRGAALLAQPALVLVLLRRRPAIATALAVTALAAVFAVAAAERPAWRARYASALDTPSLPPFEAHTLVRVAPPLLEIATRLDAAPPSRIAFVPSWLPIGQYWFRYPLLGSALQHDVVYVPPSRDGTVIDLYDREALLAAADPSAWTRRLCDDAVDLVVYLGPAPAEAAPPEVTWILGGAGFRSLWASPDGRAGIARVLPEACR